MVDNVSTFHVNIQFMTSMIQKCAIQMISNFTTSNFIYPYKKGK